MLGAELEGDLAVEARVDGSKHDAESASPELFPEDIPADLHPRHDLGWGSGGA
jgi:hypothetical protein